VRAVFAKGEWVKESSWGRIRRITRSILFLVGGITSFILSSRASAAVTLWYNGSYNLNDAYTNQSNVPINFAGSYILEKSLVYDDFIVPVGQTWTLSSMFTDDQVGFAATPTTATWEIRSGMSAGNGGTLVASGDSTVTETSLTAADGNNYIDPEYKVSIAVSSVTLASGIYWMAVAPDSTGYYGDQSYIETTSGAGAIGLPLGNDGDSFLNNNLTGTGKLTFAPSSLDFSAGVAGTVTLVPEPVSLPMVAAGAAIAFGLLRRRGTADSAV